MAFLPGLTEHKFYNSRAFLEAFASVPPVAGMVAAVCMDWGKRHLPSLPAIVLLCALLWAILGIVWRVAVNHREERTREEVQHPDSLLGCTQVLYSILAYVSGIQRKSDPNILRITVHRVVPSKNKGGEPLELEQIVPYVGGAGGSAGRRTPIHCGIVGEAIRSGNPAISYRTEADFAAFVKVLVKTQGFTDRMAKGLTNDRWSYMAIPLYDPSDNRIVTGAVYLDSSEKIFSVTQSSL